MKSSSVASNRPMRTGALSLLDKPSMKKDEGTVTRSRTSIFTLLKAEHAHVKKLYKAFEKLSKNDAPASEREDHATQIVEALKMHAEMEEAIFYPAAKEALPEDKQDLVCHADVEHESAKALIAKIEAMDASDEHFDATVCVLCEYVDHHVQEEEGELFPACREAGIDERALGQQAQAWKADVEKRAQ